MDPNWPVWLYVAAWLLPLAAFSLLVLGGKHWGKTAAYVACAAIIGAFVLSCYGFWLFAREAPDLLAGGAHGHAAAVAHGGEAHGGESHAEPLHWAENFPWIQIGSLTLSMGFWVDSLTVIMFFMVTMVSSLIFIYSIGYMHEELHDPVHDPLAVPPGQQPLHRKGRFPRFFTYLSLFCFSMLGIVIADNVFMVFMFWELVGLCSYLLIGFYYERKSASTAANKAFITNRVGDAGMIVGMMIIWSTLGTFNFEEIAAKLHGPSPALAGGLLTIAGVAIFTGCVGKSAQFPLHVWLPDAMEGPTPVSALIHAATMVAAGVYLVGRFYFLFTADALLVIAYTGGITLLLAGTIALVMTDIKRVLAYSTVSQLGYMMLGLGVGGWAAGLFHLLTHAFFKALLFLCSGSVIHGTGTQEMPQMGGLWRKMPITALTMGIGVLAISGIPLFSGYYSKDAIVAHALYFWQQNPTHILLFMLPAVGAAITAFYMFRLFYMTFTGEPRDEHVHEHAHESPGVMWIPLAVLAVASWIAGYGFGGAGPLLERVLSYRPPHVELTHVPHEIHQTGGLIALAVVLCGIAAAAMFYQFRVLSAEEMARRFPEVHRFLVNKWYFDELYDAVLVRPSLRIAQRCREFDWNIIDGLVDGAARWTVRVSDWDGRFDFRVIDGVVNWVGDWVYATGAWLRRFQTGRIRQYVMFLAIAAVGLLAVVSYLGRLGPIVFPNLLLK
jgi:NADH-quinone oxidoreductase subunit L